MADRQIPDYEPARPTWADAGPWDRAVHLTRARSRLGEPRVFTVVETSHRRFVLEDDRGNQEPLP